MVKSIQDEYTPLAGRYAIGIHGYIIVYSITSRESFRMAQIIYRKILDFSGLTQVPCVLVGSKIDLQERLISLVLLLCLI